MANKLILFLGIVIAFLAYSNCDSDAPTPDYEDVEIVDVDEEEETFKSVIFQEPYKLQADEEWPEEVAHLFGNKKEGQEDEDNEKKDEKSTKKKQRVKRWTEWVSQKLEVRPDSWDEPPKKLKPEDEPKFIAYEHNGTWIMSRCSSPKGALTIVLACPQPRGSKTHRVVNLIHAIYGWSQHESDICQFVEGDCTVRYEFVHKQIMRPTTPQTELEWRSLGPQYFCRYWDGNGRDEWEMSRKRWCAVGLRRSSQAPDPTDIAVNPWGKKYLYTWAYKKEHNKCGGPYDWFDYLHIEYTCDVIDEPIDPEATRLYHNRPIATCKGGGKTTTTAAPTNATLATTTTTNATEATENKSDDDKGNEKTAE